MKKICKKWPFFYSLFSKLILLISKKKTLKSFDLILEKLLRFKECTSIFYIHYT